MSIGKSCIWTLNHPPESGIVNIYTVILKNMLMKNHSGLNRITLPSVSSNVAGWKIHHVVLVRWFPIYNIHLL